MEAVLTTDGWLAHSESGYDGNRLPVGVVASGRGSDDQRVLVAGQSGEQVSNDHHPYYEFLVATGSERPVLSRRQVFL